MQALDSGWTAYGNAVQAYKAIMDMPRWSLHHGRDFIFADQHPGACDHTFCMLLPVRESMPKRVHIMRNSLLSWVEHLLNESCCFRHCARGCHGSSWDFGHRICGRYRSQCMAGAMV